ncbi:MAG: helix-turn-helix domain-containing protein, partial [Burkholderiales bacterium]|nr:helix-turn-helix domain-containing protein [Burkholderiales bacterium]
MSIAQMSMAWRAEPMSPTQKLVLLSLADNANDQGDCYPSVAQIVRRTCLSERAVQGAIQALEDSGFLRRIVRAGTSNAYLLTIGSALETAERQGQDLSPTPASAAPPHDVHPAADAPHPHPTCTPPPQQMHPTPAAAAPKPSLNHHLNRQGTVNTKASTVAKPADVPDAVWRDFLAIRKAKRAPMTATALRGIEREAAKAGMSLAAALAECCERGWQGFNAGWVLDQRRGGASSRRETTEEFNRRSAAE